MVYPFHGDLLLFHFLYPGYWNEREILLPCSPTCFKSPTGGLVGNRFASVNATAEELTESEETTLREGAQDVTIKERLSLTTPRCRRGPPADEWNPIPWSNLSVCSSQSEPSFPGYYRGHLQKFVCVLSSQIG